MSDWGGGRTWRRLRARTQLAAPAVAAGYGTVVAVSISAVRSRGERAGGASGSAA